MPIPLGSYGAKGTNKSGAVLERVKSVSYSATVNKLLLDVEADATEGSVKTGTVGEIEIENTGSHPAFAILAYRLWTAEGTMSGTTYHVNYLLKPGQGMIVPDSPAVISDETLEQLDGTAIRVPTSNVSLIDLTFISNKKTSINKINQIMIRASKSKKLKNIF